MTKLLTSLILASATVAAADPTDAKLAQYVGRWEGSGTFTLEGKPVTYKITYTCTRATVGPAISCSMAAAGKDLHYEEQHLIGFDKATQTYHLFSVNDWGEAYDHAAKWTDAGKVDFQYDGTANGKAMHEVYSYAFKGNDVAVHAKFSADNHTIGEGDYTMKRVP